MRLPLRVAERLRRIVPEELPLFIRISATDWVDGGWDIEQSVVFARELKELGVDLIDCSSGAIVPNVLMPIGKGYQVPFARRIRSRRGHPDRGGRHDHRAAARQRDHHGRRRRSGASSPAKCCASRIGR